MNAPWLDDGDVQLYHGDACAVLRSLPAGSVQTCVTSPPYWGLRDYGHHDQIGLEPSPEQYVRTLVAVFARVREALCDDGTLWVNLGDSYAAGLGSLGRNDAGRDFTGGGGNREGSGNPGRQGAHMRQTGLKAKDLVGIPWRVAFALQEAGWYLRSAITWCKGNAMPESVTDRPTKATEMVFLLSKQPRYYFDQDAVREERGANLRDWWLINSQPFSGAHFAVMPEALVRRCILAGTSERGGCAECGAPYARLGESWRQSCACETLVREPQVVLDPFVGSGTTCLVARKHGRRAIGVDLSADYLAIAARRLGQQSLFALDAGGAA